LPPFAVTSYNVLEHLGVSDSKGDLFSHCPQQKMLIFREGPPICLVQDFQYADPFTISRQRNGDHVPDRKHRIKLFVKPRVILHIVDDL
jgi:hypothetical protein